MAAVEVLLMTWNVEGYDPIEQDEALPQLCYVAYAMMGQRGAEDQSPRPHRSSAMHVNSFPPNLPSHVLVLRNSLSASNTAAVSS